MANLNTILEDQVSFAAANAQSIANILGSPPDGANAYSGAVLTANSAGAAEGPEVKGTGCAVEIAGGLKSNERVGAQQQACVGRNIGGE